MMMDREIKPTVMTHFGDPCIHCNIAHDDVHKGGCSGDKDKAVITSYWVKRQAYENNGSDLIRVRLSTGVVTEIGRQPGASWPYTEEFKHAKVVGRAAF